MDKPKCPVCATDSVPKFQAGEHQMYKCSNCNVSFVWPTPSDEFLTKFYSIFHKKTSEGGKYDIWENRMKLDFDVKIKKIKAINKSDLKILDVGCGKGYFVKACVENGLSAEGIDLSNSAIEYAKSSLGINAYCGRVEDHSELEGRYDVVTFWATIEHLPNPLKTLKAIKSVLQPGGYLFLDTGIGNDWLDKLLPGVNQWYDPPQHLFVFSKESLIILLEKSGFETNAIDICFDRSLSRRIVRILRGFSFAICQKLIAIILRTKVKDDFQFTRFPVGNLISITAKSKI